MATTRLKLYNGALRLLGERKLASLSENREPRRLLDEAWDAGTADGAVRHCLELGQWTFATRAIELTYSPSVSPDFGYRYAFDKPTDFIRTTALCRDEYFRIPLLEYSDEAGFWFADLQTIYVRYMSSDASYGGDLSMWPESFSKLVEAYLAVEICEPLTQSETKLKKVEKTFSDALKFARSLDAMNKPSVIPPQGSWVSARGGNYRGSRSETLG